MACQSLPRVLRISVILAFSFPFLPRSGIHAQSNGDPIQYSPGHYRILHSGILQEDRTLLISLPQGYERSPDRRFPVLFLLDGSGYELSRARGSAFERGIPPLITVAIANTNRRRDFTFGPVEAWNTPGGAEAFRDFLTEELIPFIDREYRTGPFRVLAGTSAAGFFTTFTALTAPGAFAGYIATSPMFVGNGRRVREMLGVEEGLNTSPRPGGRIAFFLGSMDYPGSTLFAPEVADGFRKAGWVVAEETLEGKGHGIFSSVNTGLAFIFREYAFPTEAFLASGAGAAEDHLGDLGRWMGMRLQADEVFTPSEMVYQGCGLLAQGRTEEATTLFSYALELYPESPRLLYRLGQAQVLGGKLGEGRETLRRAAALDEGGGIRGMVELWLREWGIDPEET